MHKRFLLLFLFVFPLLALCSQDSLVDQALSELETLENTLKNYKIIIEDLQTSLHHEKLWSIALTQQIESLQSLSEVDKRQLTEQEAYLNQARQALTSLERSYTFSKILNLSLSGVVVILTVLLLIK